MWFKQRDYRESLFVSMRILWKWWKMLLINLFLFLRYLNFCFELFILVGKDHGKKTKVNFELHGVTDWETTSYNTHIAQYLKH